MGRRVKIWYHLLHSYAGILRKELFLIITRFNAKINDYNRFTGLYVFIAILCIED